MAPWTSRSFNLVAVGLVESSTLITSSHVDHVELKSSNFLGDNSHEPRPSSDSSGLQEESGTKETIDQRVGQEGDGEGRGNQQSCNGTKSGRHTGTEGSHKKECKDRVRHSKDAAIDTSLNIQGSHTRNNEVGIDIIKQAVRSIDLGGG